MPHKSVTGPHKATRARLARWRTKRRWATASAPRRATPPETMSDGYAAAQARKEAYLASLILQDVEKRGEAVRERGVTAWAHRPREREQVNERFLRNTLRGVDSSNRRVEQQAVRSGSPAPGAGGAKRVRPEDVVVDHGRGGAGSTRRGSEGTSSSSSSAAASSSDSEPDAKPSAGNGKGGMRDDELAEFLSRPRVKRGRGAVGSRADEPGPAPRRRRGAQGWGVLSRVGE